MRHQTVSRRRLLPRACACAALLAACAASPDHVVPVQSGHMPTASAARSWSDDPADIALREAVETRLIDDPTVVSSAVDVAVADRIVTLRGVVRSLPIKRRTADIALRVCGTRAVVNRIAVNPQLVPEAELAAAVIDALVARAPMAGSNVRVSVDGSVVTLTGTVPSGSLRRVADEAVASVSGVRAVNNELVIGGRSLRADGGVHREILAAPAAVADHCRASGAANAASIRGAISDALALDPRVGRASVTIDVRGARVRLAGEVPTPAAARAAVDDAAHTRGVAVVVNALRVITAQRPDDAIAADLRGAFDRDPFIDLADVQVLVDDGHVTLTGTVDADFEVPRAARVAQAVAGVQGVSNELISTDRAFRAPRDNLIHERLQTALAGNAGLADDRIRVDVSRGIVTLAGEVDSLPERMLAQRMAVEAGAGDVINRLAIHPTKARSEGVAE